MNGFPDYLGQSSFWMVFMTLRRSVLDSSTVKNSKNISVVNVYQEYTIKKVKKPKKIVKAFYVGT
jgi:hypothetical protein